MQITFQEMKEANKIYVKTSLGTFTLQETESGKLSVHFNGSGFGLTVDTLDKNTVRIGARI